MQNFLKQKDGLNWQNFYHYCNYDHNDPQPDIALILDPNLGRKTRITDDDYIEGPPELIAEIAASTVSIDLDSKKTSCECNGIQEYLVGRVLDEIIDWFVLQEGQSVELLPDEDGITRSRIFPGLGSIDRHWSLVR